MLKLEEAWDYDDYIGSALHEHYKTAQYEMFEKLLLTKEVEDELAKIDTLTNIFVFGEISSPECRVVIPILEKMRRANKNINLYIFPRKGNEKFLSLNTEGGKIPSVMVEDVGNEDVLNEGLVLIFEEFPEMLKMELSGKSSDEKQELISSFRNGALNEKVQKELVDKVLKIIKKR
jgi:hypothetical protein